MKRIAPKAQLGWDNSCDTQEDITATATATAISSHKDHGDAGPCLDNRVKGYGVEKIREMAVQRAQSQTQLHQSRNGQPQPPSNNLTPQSNAPSFVPPPASSTRPDPKALASEIASLEYEMENCGNAVKRLQIRKNIAAKRAIMMGPL